MFMITPVGGWPEDDTVPDPDPADTDIVAFSHAVTGGDLGLSHLDACTLGPLLAAADQLSTLEPDNLPLASAVDTLRSTLMAGVTGHAAYRTRTALHIVDDLLATESPVADGSTAVVTEFRRALADSAPEQRRNLLSRLQRPDYPGLVDLILAT